MEILIFWVGFSIVVGVAANSRGRDGGGWFLLALIVSPLIAGLLVLVLPRREKPAGHGIYFSEVLPGGSNRRAARTAREQRQQDQRNGVFRPDGVVGQTPVRYLPGGVVRFSHMDHLRKTLGMEPSPRPPMS